MNNMECIVLFINNYEYQLHVPVYSYIVYNLQISEKAVKL